MGCDGHSTNVPAPTGRSDVSLTADAAHSGLPDLHVLDAEQVDALPWRLVPGCPGVAQKVF
jgi:hypothetical protein